MYSGPENLPQRAAKLWRTLRTWFAEHIPQVAATLKPGVTEEELDAFELHSHIKIPLAVRIHYRFCGGQDNWEVHAPVFESFMHQSDWGLFGGCQFYGKLMGVTFEDLEGVKRLLLDFPDTEVEVGHGPRDYYPFAGLVQGTGVYAVHIVTGQVCVTDQRLTCHFPISAEGSSMMEWMEVFAHRLTSGAYQPARLKMQHEDGMPGYVEADWQYLSTFPQTIEAGMREAITQGIRVRVSPRFIPESCANMMRPAERHLYAYSVRYYLLPVEQQEQSWPASSGPFRPRIQVQLVSRCWNILDRSGEVVDVVAGPGVIGQHPVLTAGGPEFCYESCSYSSRHKHEASSMSGHFEFVEGPMSNPQGSPFNVQSPKFELSLPEYFF